MREIKRFCWRVLPNFTVGFLLPMIGIPVTDWRFWAFVIPFTIMDATRDTHYNLQ